VYDQKPTSILAGQGTDAIQYAINAPVDINGGPECRQGEFSEVDKRGELVIPRWGIEGLA